MTDDLATNLRRQALEARYPVWVPRTTAQLLDVVAARHPARPLVFTADRTYSYADITAWSRRLAAGLIALGVAPGDHVAVDMANLPEAIALKFAIARVGAVSVSLNYRLRHEELGYVLRRSDATVLITMDRFREIDYLDSLDRIAPGWETRAGGASLPRLRNVFVHNGPAAPRRGRALAELVALGAAVTDDEVAARTAAADPDGYSDLLFTSGTTAPAKGVLLRHDAVLRTAYASAYTRAFGDGRRILFALPVYHVFGYVEGLLAVLFAGGAVRPQTVFDAAGMLRDVSRYRIDELMCVPSMTMEVLAAARDGEHDLSSLRAVFSSGAPHEDGAWEQIRDVLGVDEIFTGYGQTETSASTTCTRPGDAIDRLRHTNGALKPAGVAGDPALGGVLAVYKTVHPETGEDLPVGTPGELVARGPIMTSGYYRDPAETQALFTPDGWLRTGDLGRLDDEGYLMLTGRKKDCYRCGGELVTPGEVERVLTRHPGVRAAYVVAVPDDRMGEVGCAWIVPAAGRPRAEDLIGYCASRLARFKVPAVVLFTEAAEVPTTATGRVRKFLLAERAVRVLRNRPGVPGPAGRQTVPATTGG
ncbi:class I adenylate-forming enzyme family protein [Amycolatopsis sp.]|uniref:class I adenylate-forming enzyme family protein n=1 Tax=Amycolatopsis sp. TaxID=37632 RepID=UPI002BD8DF20|nr:AMP-binding protein [Amycolatopsis sp.]HVV08241.1 AMP-binding protein [Amycolatopsis sp.]